LQIQLRRVGGFLNKENLAILVGSVDGFRSIERDVVYIEEYLGEELSPVDEEGHTHLMETSKILEAVSSGRQPDLLRAARIRKSLG
jgi:hypothetical protein